MIVCVCKAVSDRHIRAAVKAGATTLRDLGRTHSIGTCCGKCMPEAKAVLKTCLAEQADTETVSYFPRIVPATV